MNELRSPIIVYSHLRWDSVFQRPHHIVTRLARQQRVLFVEEPCQSSTPGWDLRKPRSGLLVARPRTTPAEPGFNEVQTALLADMTRELLLRAGVRDHVAWLYTPMALDLARALEPSLLAYDCMDELSAFLGAPSTLPAQERELFRCADVVFTGGPSLYRAKRHHNPNVHLFPSSVDAAHFATARSAEDHPAQAALPHPRLGFFGVLDERLNVPLLAALADARPHWQIALVGPVAKIDPASLPQRANLHYLGRRSYEELPQFLAGWDVCLLPFALNAATRYISPTKTLEYMAAERPIVSTPIVDVAEPYADAVYLGEGPEEFVAACERALRAGPVERALRSRCMREILAQTSWDATVEAMQRELVSAARRRRDVASAAAAICGVEREAVAS